MVFDCVITAALAGASIRTNRPIKAPEAIWLMRICPSPCARRVHKQILCPWLKPWVFDTSSLPVVSTLYTKNLNPVRARLVSKAEDWAWSSVRAHLAARDDGLVSVRPVLDRVTDFGDLVRSDADDPGFTVLRAAEQTGRPLGTADFVADLEQRLARAIARRAPGRKPALQTEEQRSLF